jgi:2-methylcitrate dehydratase PrpD
MMRERIGPGDIESIEVHLPGRSARTVDNAPMSNLNLQHLMAMLLVDGALSFESIHAQERMQEPAIFSLRRKIVLVESDELAQAMPRRQAIVAVKTRDGRSLSKRVFAVRGTADNPMSQAEVEAKAFDLIGSVFGARRAHAILRAMAKLEIVPDVAALRHLWQVSAKTHAARGLLP